MNAPLKFNDVHLLSTVRRARRTQHASRMRSRGMLPESSRPATIDHQSPAFAAATQKVFAIRGQAKP